MTQRRGTNIAASIRQRLLNKARETGRPFNEVLQYFAMERFLYRLSKSAHSDKFVLKGALMFAAWQAPVTRPTMDIDLLGITDNRVEAISAVVRDICRQDVEPDGLVFDAAAPSRGSVSSRTPTTPAFACGFGERWERLASPCKWISASEMSLCQSQKRQTIPRFWTFPHLV